MVFNGVGFFMKIKISYLTYITHEQCQCNSVPLPSTSDLPGLVPDLLEEGIILHNDRVLDEGALRGRGSKVVRISASRHPALKIARFQ